MPQDSPLSITASVTGILTFVVAVALGLYARALSLREILRIDYHIIEELVQCCQNMAEAAQLEKSIEESLRQSSRQGHGEPPPLKEMFIDEFALEVSNCVCLIVLLNSSRIRRLTEWENTRRQVSQRSIEASALKGKIRYGQMMTIFKNMDIRIDKVSDGLRGVEYRLVDELRGIRSALMNPPSLSRPSSQQQDKVKEQPSSSDLGAFAGALAEEHATPSLLETTLQTAIETPIVPPKQTSSQPDKEIQQPVSPSLGTIVGSLAEEHATPSQLEMNSHPAIKTPVVPPKQTSSQQDKEHQQPVSSSLRTTGGSLAEDNAMPSLLKTSPTSVELPVAPVKVAPTTNEVPLVPLSSTGLEPPSLLDEAYRIARHRLPHEFEEYERFLMRTMADSSYYTRRATPDERIGDLKEVTNQVIHQTLLRMEEDRTRISWTGRHGQKHILNCFC